MVDKKALALRYLLLHHVWSLKDKVDSNLYKEVTTSISIQRNRNNYQISWKRYGEVCFLDVKRRAFEFYVRGDLATSKENRVNSRQNQEYAQKLALILLGLPDSEESSEKASVSHFPDEVWNLLAYVTGPALIYVIGGTNSALLALSLLIMFICEYWFRMGKLLIPFVLFGLSVSYPITVALTGSFFGITQFLDPDKLLRKSRILLGWASAVFGVSEFVLGGMLLKIGFWFVPFCLVALLAFVFRWTSGTHTRSFPLIFPMFAVGLYLDSAVTFAWVTLFLAIGSAIFCQKGHLVFKVQREVNLTPNG